MQNTDYKIQSGKENYKEKLSEQSVVKLYKVVINCSLIGRQRKNTDKISERRATCFLVEAS